MEFKHHKILTFKEDKRILLSIGLKKCKLILLHLKEIEDFVKRNNKAAEPENKPPEPQGNDIISNSI